MLNLIFCFLVVCFNAVHGQNVDCIKYEMDSYGNDITGLFVQNYLECRDHCLKDEDCKMYGMWINSKLCWLKHSILPELTHQTDFIVTTANCTDVCFEEGLEYQSEPVAVVPNVDSPASCLDECKNNNDCLFFSYDNDTKDCTLTNSNDSKVPVSSASSGSVLC